MSARILLVDDDFSVRETLSDILKANGYEVVECANASEAVDVVSKQPFDCAVIGKSIKTGRVFFSFKTCGT